MVQGGGRKSPYPEEFTKDAVELYRAAAGKRTYSAVAADLGIMAESLRTWVRKDDSQAVPGRREAGGSEAEEMARLRAENAWPLKQRRNGSCSVSPAPGSRLFRPGGEVTPHRWDFISENRASLGVKRICRALGVSRSGYDRHVAAAQARARRQAEEKRTVGEIRATPTTGCARPSTWTTTSSSTSTSPSPAAPPGPSSHGSVIRRLCAKRWSASKSRFHHPDQALADQLEEFSASC